MIRCGDPWCDTRVHVMCAVRASLPVQFEGKDALVSTTKLSWGELLGEETSAGLTATGGAGRGALSVPQAVRTTGYGSVAAAASLVRSNAMMHAFELSIDPDDLRKHRRAPERSRQPRGRLPRCAASFDFRCECPRPHPWRTLPPASA